MPFITTDIARAEPGTYAPLGADESTPAVVSGLGTPKIRRRGVLGGLINDYERAA